MKKTIFGVLFFLFLFTLVFSKPIFAHEAYVLDYNFFWSNLSSNISFHALDALKDPENLRVTLIIVTSVLLLLGLNFVFRESSLGDRVEHSFEKIAPYGPLFIRLAIAAAFFYSAKSMSFLGPELKLGLLPFAHIAQIILYASSIMILFGFLTELAAFAALILFTIGLFKYGLYLITYLNYLGEILVLFFFGMRKWSIDGLIFGPLNRFQSWKKYDTTIVRVFYGIALIFAAVTVKFLHPELTVQVVNHWNLTQFHWLFPRDPLLVTLGAGLAEMAIGLFIVFGFEMRLTIFISLFYITLSLLFFRELVWPHLMLYGISLNLIVQPEIFTVDHFIFENKRHKFWKRPLLAHTKGAHKMDV